MSTAITRPEGVTLELLTIGGTYAPYAYVEHAGVSYVVCVEGVGWDVNNTDKPLYVQEWDEGMSYGEKAYTLDEVREHLSGKTIDLADLVRVFGSRLESNFYQWHSRLTSSEAVRTNRRDKREVGR